MHSATAMPKIVLARFEYITHVGVDGSSGGVASFLHNTGQQEQATQHTLNNEWVGTTHKHNKETLWHQVAA